MVAAWHVMGGALTGLEAAAPAPAAAPGLWAAEPAAAAAASATAASPAPRLEELAAAQVAGDRAFLAWAESPAGRARIAVELKALRAAAAARLVADMVATAEGRDGLLRGLQAALGTDTALATQLRSLVAGL